MGQKVFKTRGTKTSYQSDVSDEEWEFCAAYLTLMKEDAAQREYTMRGLFNAVRYMVRAGCPWRMIPNDLPPWSTVHQQAARWIKAGCFEAMAHDLRQVLRMLAQKQEQPSAVILMDARCSPPRKAEAGLATMDTSAGRVPKCMWRWILWAISWL